ncbi:MAG: hypothetical protein AAFR52_19725 [Pseudomonadota bacterium]
MTRLLTAAALAAFLAAPALPTAAAPLCDGKAMGFAGLLAKCNKGEELELTLAAGKPLADGPITLQSGAYYEMMIVSDGSQELALVGPEFFRAVWMDEIVINDLEIRPMAIDSFEFDNEGTIEFSFIAIKPGRYEMKIPGSTGESQRVQISIQ